MSSHPRFFLGVTGAVGLSLLAIGFPAAAPASVTFGTLSNFDVFNDTGDDTHGFEIELEGLTSDDVAYTFGDPYQRYGNPAVENFAGGVYVRYQSAYDAGQQKFVAGTPQAPAVIAPTDGHACWTGGSGDYLTSGCEHFGVSLNRNPTNTVYRWLVADPGSPGALKRADTRVNIPAPVWNVEPPPPELPDQVHPVVVAVIEPPAPDKYEFGDALWMKIFKTESPEPAELHHLVSDDDRVPDEPAETEMEWQLLQSEVGVGHEAEQRDQIDEGNESVTRRYEFYQYTGPYDAETHEARPEHDSAPVEGEVGNYIGSQMAAVNLVGLDPTTTSTTTTTTTTSSSSSSTSSTMFVPLCGDANDDGKLTAPDALFALKAAVGLATSCSLASCDTDHNGAIQASDALRILRAAVGQPVLLDCAP